MIPKWDEPKIFWDRLHEPMKRKKPANIFVGSMCDLFGDWCQRWWIQAVVNMCVNCPQHTFFFLTKNPKRYVEFKFPENCWLGATVTGEASGKSWPNCLDGDPTSDMYNLPNKKFLSIEPILGSFFGHRFDFIDQIIVGADSRRGAPKPKRKWIKSIKHPSIYYKENIRE